MPFRDPERSLDLHARLEAEVRQRIEEAVDHACLDAMARARRARGLPPPRVDSAGDRQEFDARVAAFLERLGADLLAGVTPEQQEKARGAGTNAGAQGVARLVTVQVALAKELPDYWQRFEAVSVAYTAEAEAPAPDSGGERRGLLGRLFGGGAPGRHRP